MPGTIATSDARMSQERTTRTSWFDRSDAGMNAYAMPRTGYANAVNASTRRPDSDRSTGAGVVPATSPRYAIAAIVAGLVQLVDRRTAERREHEALALPDARHLPERLESPFDELVPHEREDAVLREDRARVAVPVDARGAAAVVVRHQRRGVEGAELAQLERAARAEED